MSTSAIVDEFFFPPIGLTARCEVVVDPMRESRSDEEESRWVRERVEVGEER